MSANPASRVNYFDRQYLRLSELTDEQAYHLQLHRRHNLAHHSWGIVVGLEIIEDGTGVAVSPGLAVDGYGRELVLLQRRHFDRTTFDRMATNRIDLWLEYRLTFSSDPNAPLDCDARDPRQGYRATELAEIVAVRAGTLPDVRHPPYVPGDAFIEPQLDTPDDPALRWPVYLGRMIMQPAEAGDPKFFVEDKDRAYAGLVAELVDHPGNACRIELGRKSPNADSRSVGAQKFAYAADPTRDFAVFVPDPAADPAVDPPVELQPTWSVFHTATQIRGSVEVHGNVELDGASLQFVNPATATTAPPDTGGHPALYRASNDELRIDVGELNNADRSFVIGVSKNGVFNKAITIKFPSAMTGSGPVNPIVTVHGDLHIDGTIESPDIRTRTLTEDVAAMLTGMIQAAIASGGS